MAYSRSVKSIQNMKSYLDAMVKSKDNLKWLSDDARRLKYKLYEAIDAAEHHKFPPYNKLAEKYIIRVRDDSVVAELRTSASSRLTFDVTDPFGIVQTIIKHKDIDFELFFNEATALDEDDLEMIHDYCKDNGYSIHYSDIGLLVTKT
jgi:hypothetical protein